MQAYRRANAVAHGYRRTHPHTYKHLDAHVDAVAHANPDANRDRYSNSHAHSHLDANPDTDADANSDANTDPDPDTASYLDTDAGLCPANRDPGSRGKGTVGARHARRQRYAGCQPDL